MNSEDTNLMLEKKKEHLKINEKISIKLIKQRLNDIKNENQFNEVQKQFSNQMAFKQISVQLNRKRFPEYHMFLNYIEDFVLQNFCDQQILSSEKIRCYLPFQEAMLLYQLLICLGSQNIQYSSDFDKVLVVDSTGAIKERLDYLLSNEDINYSKLDDGTKEMIKDFLFREKLLFLTVEEVYEYLQKNREKSKLTLQEKILKLIVESHEPLSLADLSRKTSTSSHKIIKIIENSNKIIEIEKDKYVPLSFFALDENVLMKWKNQLETISNKYYGYCNAQFLFKKLQIYLKKTKIGTDFALFNILKIHFSNQYQFSYPHIIKDSNTVNFSFKDFPSLIIKKDKEININKLTNLLKELEVSERMRNLAIKEVRDNYLQVSTEDYIEYNQLNLSSADLVRVYSILSSDLSNIPYLVLKNASLHLLPAVGIEWTEALLKEIINKYLNKKFKVIEAGRDINYQYKIPVLVNATSPISTYEDLIIYIIREEYNKFEKMNIKSIEDFLRYEKEVIWNNLSSEIKSSKHLQIDEYGRISLIKEELDD